MPTNSSQKNNINLRPTATSFRPMAAAPSDPALKRIVQEQDGILEEIQNQLHATGDITIEMRTSMARQKGDIEAATEGVETTTEYLAELTKKAEKVEREANSNLFLFLKLGDCLLFAAFIFILIFGLQTDSSTDCESNP